MILSTSSKKSLNFVKKIYRLPKKSPNDLEKLHPDFSEKCKDENITGHVAVFLQNLGITVYNLELTI